MIYRRPYIYGWILGMVKCPPTNRDLGSVPEWNFDDDFRKYFEETVPWNIPSSRDMRGGMYNDLDSFDPSKVIPVFMNDQEINEMVGTDILTEYSKEGIPLKVYTRYADPKAKMRL